MNKYGCSKVTVFGPVGCMAAKNKQTIVDKIAKNKEKVSDFYHDHPLFIESI
ncbi:hypothetical protein ACVNPZ_00900 [Staphylococcus aureus]